MILFIIIWLFLGFSCYLYGFWVLNLLNIHLFEHPFFEENRESGAIVIIWIGLLLISSLLLLISLFAPLSLSVFILLNTLLLIVSLSTRSVRSSLLFFSQLYSFSALYGGIAVLFLVAFISTANVTLYDSALYHFQLIQWLSKWGNVPGLALLHHRLGFTSIWFTLVAPFNTGFLETRMIALMGGFSILLALAHQIISLKNLIKNRPINLDKCSPDCFLVVATFLSIPYLINATLATSASPDTPVIILTIELSWLILVLANFNSINLAQTSKESIDFTSSDRTTNSTRNLYLLPLILSAGAMNIKFSAFPLVLVSLLFYSFQPKFSFSFSTFINFSKGTAIAGLIISPVLITNLVTSSCPLYPSPTLCTNLPWSIAPEDASQIAKIIQDWARWWGPTPENATNFNWILPWLRLRKEAAFLLLTSLFSICILGSLPKYRKLQSTQYLLILALIGISFMLYKAPDMRFGLGFLIVAPSLAVALTLRSHIILGEFLFFSLVLSFYFLYFLHFSLENLNIIFIISVLLIFFIVAMSRSFTSGQIIIFKLLVPVLFLSLSTFPVTSYLLNSNPLSQRILFPPQMSSLAPSNLLTKEAENFTYYIPKEGDRCFASPLPCTPYLTYDNVQLRDKLNLSKGFKHKIINERGKAL
ncbi:MAG: LIC_10190 family membrane protein [Spirulinaceae cyanobacterium]